ncbi:hypothetical protein PENARI_c011G08616 [Penicillium arizonense]|uniref:Uncharacterized protein n=1 Tax=Penicillium arizonense TaxID=1835702 RepID=A0A1F5LGL8_PENAI|nr:hypothetical protein PENARI_c011G08616 [Penicillium arizonense]OGE52091.1 hypothetical protein PENARI_c011G08616 [Penicillium arizonense]
MTRKKIFLVGSPLSSTLKWDKEELLNNPIYPFEETYPQRRISVEESARAKWRALPSTHEIDHNISYQGHVDPEFLVSDQLEVAPDASRHLQDSVLSKFYHHSFLVHETSEVSASELEIADSTQESSLGEDSVITSTYDKDAPRSPRILHIPGPLRDLQDLPTAKYIQSIAPQTMTVNLIVAVLAAHPSRRVVTRQWKTELDIVELVVADETKTGFGVNFWIKPENPSVNDSETGLARSLAGLRPCDIVLLRNVGLSTFQSQVYGQSLRRGMTTVELLHRQAVDVTDAVGFYESIQSNVQDAPLQKTRKVREWLLRFVTDAAGGGSGMLETRGRLPPDTQ